MYPDCVNSIVSGVSSFFVGLLCGGALVGICIMAVYLWRRHRVTALLPPSPGSLDAQNPLYDVIDNLPAAKPVTTGLQENIAYGHVMR